MSEVEDTPYAAMDRARARRRRRRRRVGLVAAMAVLVVGAGAVAAGYPRWQAWDQREQRLVDAGVADQQSVWSEIGDALRSGREVLLDAGARTDDHAARDALAGLLEEATTLDAMTIPVNGSRAEQGAEAHARAAVVREHAARIRAAAAALSASVGPAG